MKTQDVDPFLDNLGNPQRELIVAVRAVVKASEPRLKEGIKWNAPSYSLDGNDIVTFNFRNFGAVALIFHTGAKGKDTHTGVRAFSDAPTEIHWLADKRFVLTFSDAERLEGQLEVLRSLVTQWTTLASKGFTDS